MWLLTTRNRQAMCQEVIDRAIDHGMSTPGVVWCDGCEYTSLRLPVGWSRIECREHLNIGEIMRRFHAEHPDLPWYGWMADDCIPLSDGWDKHLVRAAGQWSVAYPDDNWLHGVKDRDGTPHVTSIVCMGGDLVRAMGFWVRPGHVQAYIDDTWESVAVPLGLMRYCPTVKSDHRHVHNARRKADATDAVGVDFRAADKALYMGWIRSDEYLATLERVGKLIPAPAWA